MVRSMRARAEASKFLDAEQKLVFLISEAEVLCDMEGIDSFLDRYAPRWVPEAAAFEAVGAAEIAAELRAAPFDALFTGDPRLDRVNELITGRVEYAYEAIRRVVEGRRRTLSV